MLLACLLRVASPDIFQVCCNTWNSSLNRRELFEHLRIAHSKGGMVFQAAEAETTRRFLKAILDGKGLPAECTLPPHAAEGAVANAHVPPPEPMLQTMPGAYTLFLGAVFRTEPLWFHPSLAEQLSMGLDSIAAATAAAAAAGIPLPAIAAPDDSSAAAGNDSGSPQAHILEVAERPSLQTSLLVYVQFVSIAQPATSRQHAIPNVVICNTVRASKPPDNKEACGGGADENVALAAASTRHSSLSQKRRRALVRRIPTRPPPTVSSSEEEEESTAGAASTTKRTKHPRSMLEVLGSVTAADDDSSTVPISHCAEVCSDAMTRLAAAEGNSEQHAPPECGMALETQSIDCDFQLEL